MPVEAGTFGGHQIHPLHAHHRRGVEEFFDHPAAQAMALQITGHHDVPEHGAPIDPVELYRKYSKADASKVRKRLHSKVYHDEESRCIKNNYTPKEAKASACKAAAEAIARWLEVGEPS